MFGIGSTELVIILIVALVLIGPSKLPDLMKSLGKGLSEFRRMSTDVKSTLQREIDKADEAKRIEEERKALFDDQEQAKAQADAAQKAAPEPAAPQAPATETAAAGVATAAADTPAAAPAATPAPAEASKPQDAAAAPGKTSEKSHA